MNNTELVIEKLVFTHKKLDYITQFEVAWKLKGRVDLLGLYIWLSILVEYPQVVTFANQKQLAKFLEMSWNTFVKKKNELEAFGLIKLERNKKGFTELHVFSLTSVNLIEILCSVQKLNHRGSKIEPVKNFAQLSEFAEAVGKSAIPLTEEISKNELSSTIYNNTNNSKPNNNTNNISNNTNIDVKDKIKRYPREDYQVVIDGYQKYKGIKLSGPEISPVYKAIKLMFQAGHKVKAVLDFMKWLHDNESNEEMPWVKLWTIWTVQKKMPEFVAGKLKSKTLDDDYETIA